MSLTERLMVHLTSEHEEGDRGVITNKGEILFSNPDVMEHILNWLYGIATGMQLSACRYWRCVAQCLIDTHEEGKRDIITLEEESEFQFSDADVMEQVFSRLNDVVTRIRFSAVCRSWRWVAQRCGHRTPLWLFLSLNDESDHRKCFSLSDGVTHRLHLAEAYGWHCCGSFEGWLIMQTKNWMGNKVFLIDPLSKVQIHLPIMKIDHLHGDRASIVSIAFLSSAPKSNDGTVNKNCLVVAVDCSNYLHVCRLGDKSWTRHHFYDLQLQHFPYVRMLFHEGMAVVSSVTHDIFMVMEFDRLLNFRAKIHYFRPRILDLIIGGTRYLVEWCGEILLVFDSSKRKKAFQVYKISSRWNLEKVESLGDGMIFLINDQPKCLSVKDFPALNLKGNCIYYLPSEGRCNQVYAFHLEDGRLERCNNPIFQCVIFHWYAPNIHY